MIVLSAALAVSLWFNWRNQTAVADAKTISPSPTEAAAPAMPMKLGEIDFSGTGLADETWELSAQGLEEKIPAVLPVAESDGKLESEPKVAVPNSWDPDVKLKLDSRPP